MRRRLLAILVFVAAAGTVLENAWPLALIALVTMTSAAWLFRRRME